MLLRIGTYVDIAMRSTLLCGRRAADPLNMKGFCVREVLASEYLA